jgi:hypothetical protein
MPCWPASGAARWPWVGSSTVLGCGSLGEFIQTTLKVKMNPAVYVAALLIDEGYAERARGGYVRFIAKKSE